MSRWDDVRMLGELVGRSGFSLSVTDGAIELCRGRSFGLTAARLVLTVFLLPFLLAPLLLLLEPDIPFNIPAALFYVIWYGTLGGFTWFASTVLFRWRTVRVDGERGRLEMHGSGRLLWLPRRVSVPLDAVRKLELRMGPEGWRPTPFIWRLTCAPWSERPRKLTIGATVDAINRREEALHLTARIVRLMGWEAFELTRGDDLAAVVRFARNEAHLENPRQIPPLEEVLDYGEDEGEGEEH